MYSTAIKLIKVSLITVVFLFCFGDTAKAEMSTYDKNRMLGATSRDWQSSSLREWLNSEQSSVDYTALPPPYKDEPGFLSAKNFTRSELDGIAITKHGHGWQYSLSGNTNDTLYYSQRSVAHNDYVSNDKVFILHYTDLVNYIEKNKLLFERYKKHYSNYLQSTTNKLDRYDYLVNSGYYNSGYGNVSVMYTSGYRQVNARDAQNIVPALSLYPDYVLNTGKKAKTLKVGDTVTFGTYMGEEIEWEVINKSDSGHPLLWSTRILTTKKYDEEGDINPSTSDVLSFPNHDVDIYSGRGQAKSRETQLPMDSTTTISFLNDSVLTTPTNESSITLKIKATDSKYGIRSISLPDGTVISGEEVEWTFMENGEYDIVVENGQGVITVKHFITKAINTPAIINITTDKDESTPWTNKPVTVNVSASNNGVYNLRINGNREMKYGSTSSNRFPSWMSLGGKRLHIKGTLKNAMTAEELASVSPAKVRMRLNYTWYNSGQRGMTYPLFKEFALEELYEKKEIVIDEVITMPTNIYEGYYATINMMDSNTAYMKSPYNYWISDFTYEILDKDDLSIEEITLPDGSKVVSDSASYVIKENGEYTFSVRDNRGKITEKTIEVLVDTIKPTVAVKGVLPHPVKEQTLTVSAQDNESGIRRIRLPNGEYRYPSGTAKTYEITYNVNENGVYTFSVEDFAGNVRTESVNISNVDNIAPVLNFTLSDSDWTNNIVMISVQSIDALSGTKQIQLPNGTIIKGDMASYTVSNNGKLQFYAEDNFGNKGMQELDIRNIDTIAPSISIFEEHASVSEVGVTIRVWDE